MRHAYGTRPHTGWRAEAMIPTSSNPELIYQLAMSHDHSSHSAIDVHTHVVPEKFPAYGGSTPDIPWQIGRAHV